MKTSDKPEYQEWINSTPYLKAFMRFCVDELGMTKQKLFKMPSDLEKHNYKACGEEVRVFNNDTTNKLWKTWLYFNKSKA